MASWRFLRNKIAFQAWRLITGSSYYGNNDRLNPTNPINKKCLPKERHCYFKKDYYHLSTSSWLPLLILPVSSCISATGVISTSSTFSATTTTSPLIDSPLSASPLLSC